MHCSTMLFLRNLLKLEKFMLNNTEVWGPSAEKLSFSTQ